MGGGRAEIQGLLWKSSAEVLLSKPELLNKAIPKATTGRKQGFD
jgi:hypothetical protein